MDEPFTLSLSIVRRVLYTMLAALLLVATIPLVHPGQANAAQLSSRSIQLSDSSVSGGSIVSGVGSGASVTYLVTFTTSAFAGHVGSLVIDFCSQSPIINETCTAPTGFTAASAALNATAVSGTVQTTTDNWAVTDSAGQVKIADDNAQPGNAHPTHDIQASTTESFALTGITNPSSANCTVGANCSFYARIYTYSGNAWNAGSYVSPTNVGTYVDYGGIAMSTTNPITISATVQEQLTYCVTALDPNGGTPWNPAPSATADGCSATNLTAPALVLGHGSPTVILDSQGDYAQSAFTSLSTNATHGAVVDMRNSNLTCTGSGGAGGLSADNGATCGIPPIGNGAVGPWQLTAGTADFGLFVATDTVAGAGTVGAVTPSVNYNDGTHTGPLPAQYYYGMDTGGGAAGVVGTYGDTIASTTSPTFNAFNQLVFGATASLTTPAGIYTANLSLIATGTF